MSKYQRIQEMRMQLQTTIAEFYNQLIAFDRYEELETTTDYDVAWICWAQAQ